MAIFAEYSFDEGTGTTAADNTGNGHTLTGVPGWGAGHTGSGLATSNQAGPQLTTGTDLSTFTIEFWVKFTATGSWQSFAEMNDGSYLWFEIDGSGALDVYHDPGGLSLNGGTLSGGAWHHLAYVHGPTTSELFVDGASVSSAASGSQILSGSYGLYIGGSSDQPGTCVVDDFRLYDTALTAAEVAADMSTPVGGSASTDVTTAGAAASLTLAAPAGDVASSTSTSVDVTAAPDALSLSAPAGEASAGSSSTDATATTVAASLSLTAPVGVVEVSDVLDATPAVFALTAPTGGATVVANTSVSAAPAALSLSAPTGNTTATDNGTDATIAAGPGVLTFTAPDGSTLVTGNVSVSALAAALNFDAPAGSTGAGVNVDATTAPAPLTLSTPTGALTVASSPVATASPAALTLAAPVGRFSLDGLVPGAPVRAPRLVLDGHASTLELSRIVSTLELA